MNNIPRIDINDLYDTKQRNDLQKVETFNKLLEKIHDKIKLASRQRVNNEFCYYIMPEVLIGYPNYDFQQCLFYILTCLQNDGFLTKYIHPNLILISWRHIVPKYVRDEIHKKTGKIVDLYGKEIVEENNRSVEVVKKDKILKDVPINNRNTSSTYKPSGKFIYDKDVLSKIQEIL
jgi:hypothetical protein|tara:strand:- start:276 stop:803 length:528 start_codon:yes stop_codon:yes gene_type:complete